MHEAFGTVLGDSIFSSEMQLMRVDNSQELTMPS